MHAYNSTFDAKFLKRDARAVQKSTSDLFNYLEKFNI